MPESFKESSKFEDLKIKVLNALSEFGIVDKFLQQRAIDIIEKTKIREHIKPDGVYLDIGTGLGHIVEKIVKEEDGKSVKFLALDPTWKPLKKVRKRIERDMEGRALFIKATGDELPVEEKSVDGVTLFFVTHHLPPEIRDRIFEETERVLKKDGLIFLVEDTPDDEEEKERNAKWDRRLNFESKDEKHYYQSNEEWQKFFEENNYEIIDQAYFEDMSPKKDEGLIRHRSYVLKRKEEI